MQGTMDTYLAALFAIGSFAAFAYAGDAPEDRANIETEQSDVIAVSQRDFPSFLAAAWSSKEEYGFQPEDREGSVSLARPVRVYGIDEETAMRAGPSRDLYNELDPVGEWIFPVQVGGTYRTLFGVRLLDGKWRGTYFGNPYLAKSLQSIRHAWSSKDEDSFHLVSCVRPRSFLYIVRDGAYPNLTPVTPIALCGTNAVLPPRDWRNLKTSKDMIDVLMSVWVSEASKADDKPIGRKGN